MKHFTKKLALLSLLAGMCGSAWAEDTYEIVYSRALAEWTDADKTEWNASSAVEVNTTYGLGANANSTATYVSQSFDVSDNAKIKYEVDWTYATATGRTNNWNWIQFGDKVRIAVNSSYNMQVSTDAGSSWNTTTLGYYKNNTFTKHIEIIFDTQLKKVESFSFDGTDYTSLVAGTLDGAFNTVSTGFVRGGSVSWTLNNYITAITVSEAEQAEAAKVDYTVKYIYNDDVIKTVEGTEAIGSTISAESPITIDDVKYYAVDGSTMSMELVEGTNTLEITLRQADTFSYTVVNNFGETITEGSVVEGESVIFAYPEYIEIDGTLYKTSLRNATGDGNFLYKISPTSDGEELTINYTEAVTDVVFFAEAEEIEGATANNGNNTNIRCSNAYGAYFEDAVTVATLPAGVYKATVQVWGNTGTTFNILAGETTVLEAATVGYLNTYTSEEFTLTKETNIIIPAAGSNGKVIDYVYIVKTGDVVPGTLAAGKFATRIFPFAPAAIEGVKYYSCAGTQDGTNTLALTEVSAPEANVPYILENTTEAEIDITQTGIDIHEAETYTEGYLTGVFSNDVVAPVGSYVLQTQSGKQAFYVVEEGVEIKNMQYRAYLTTANNVKALYLSGDDVTAINTLDALTSGAYEGIYTADGVKLNRIEKGVNILKMADGTTRKVIVK